jgi:hypothetical protein
METMVVSLAAGWSGLGADSHEDMKHFQRTVPAELGTPECPWRS